MLKGVYCVRDNKGSFMDPFVDLNDACAIRGFCYSLQHNPGIIGFSPSDYSLYVVGNFDTLTGTVSSLPPKPIYQASDFFASGGEPHA